MRLDRCGVLFGVPRLRGSTSPDLLPRRAARPRSGPPGRRRASFRAYGAWSRRRRKTLDPPEGGTPDSLILRNGKVPNTLVLSPLQGITKGPAWSPPE